MYPHRHIWIATLLLTLLLAACAAASAQPSSTVPTSVPTATTGTPAPEDPQLVAATLLTQAQTPTISVSLPLIMKPSEMPSGNLAVSTIDIVDSAFQPSYGVQAVGAQITWVNKGDTTHTVTFDDGSVDCGPLEPGQRFTLPLQSELGFRLTYHCSIHPEMTGVVDVLPPKTGLPPPPTPTP